MAYTLRLYLRLLSVQIRSQLQYRVAFGLDLVATAVIVVVEFASIALVFELFGTMQGWSLGEVAFLYGMAEMGFGLMDMLFAGFDPPNFGRMVRQGSFDQLMLRPVNITVQVMGAELTLRRLGKVLLGVAIFLFANSQLSIQWTAAKLLYLPLVVVGMVLFFGGLFIIGATITFWTVESIEVMNTLTYGGSFVISHPMHIYPVWMRRIFTFIIPAIFLNYYPALFFLDKADPLGAPPWVSFLSPVVGLVLFLLALRFWRFGVKHYQSTGT